MKLLQHPPLRLDHVRVAVLREPGMESVAGPGRGTVADAVGKHDEVARRIEELPRPEERAREGVAEKLRAAAGGAVQDQHRVVSPQRAERAVVQPQLGHRLARGKGKIAHRRVSFRVRQRCEEEGKHSPSLPQLRRTDR